MGAERSWAPFKICQEGEKSPGPRSIQTPAGVADRLRYAAFAEIQAREAFLWATDHYEDAPKDLKSAWRKLATQEHKHLSWLLFRLEELGYAVDERPMSLVLWESFTACQTAQEFAVYMASAEERGRIAGEKFAQALEKYDRVSAAIFGQIAKEEIEHIELAEKHFAWKPGVVSAQRKKATEALQQA